MSLREEYRESVAKYGGEYHDIQTVRLGRLDGHTVQTGVNGELWARQWNGKEIKVLNRAMVPAIFDLRVLVGIYKTQPNRWFILQIMNDYLTPAGGGLLAYHHAQHEFGGPDIVWVNRKQITSFTVLAKTGFTVQIYGGVAVLATGVKILPHQTLDMTSYVPTYGAIYANIEVDEDFNVSVHTGVNFGSPAAADPSYIPVPDTGKYILAYVMLYQTMTSLTNEFIVVPMPFSIPVAGTGGGGSPITYDDLSSQAPGTDFTLANTPDGVILLFYNTTFQGADTYSVTGTALTTTFTVAADDILIAIYGVTGGGGGGAGGHIIEDEGTPLTARTNLNFIGTGVTVTDNAGTDSTDVTIDSGSGGGQSLSSYYQAGGHDTITNNTDGNLLSIDTEYVDLDSISHLGGSNDVVVDNDGTFTVRALVGIHGSSAFNGKTTAYLGDVYTTKTYETAESITNDIFEVGPYVLQITGGSPTLTVLIDNHLGETINAWVYELTIEPHQSSGGGGGTPYTDEQAQDAVGAMIADTDTLDLTYVDATPQLKGDVKTQMSITSDASGLKLSGDTASPGNNQVYGTDGSGVKGWKADPTVTPYTDEQAQDAVGGMIADTDTIDLTYTDATPELKADVKKQMSITSDSSGLKLSGDATTPGANQVYGTDGAGVKGWKADPSGGAVDASAVTFTPADNTKWDSSADPGNTDDALDQLAARAKALEITASTGGAGDDVLAIAMSVAL